MQGRADDQRELLDAESVAGHLLKSDSMFAFLAGHRGELFPEEMFADLFPSRRGRPSVPAEVMASVKVASERAALRSANLGFMILDWGWWITDGR